MTEEQAKKDWSSNQLADAAGVSRQYVVRLLNEGKELKGHKVGNYWIVRDHDAKAWLENRRA